MRTLSALFMALAFMGCNSTKVVVVTTVVTTKDNDKISSSEDWYEGPMDTSAVKKLLNDTLDAAAEKPYEKKD